MPNRIKELRQAKGFSMRQLGELAGTSAQQINKLEKGQTRLTVDWMLRLAPHLGCDPKDLMDVSPLESREKPLEATGGTPTIGSIYRGSPVPGSDRTLPILGRVRGSRTGVFQMPVSQEPVGWTYRPRQLEDVKEAYGVLVYDESMSPKYEHGQIAWVHPDMTFKAGDGVVVVKRNDEAIIKILVARTDDVVRLRQLNPEATFEIPRNEVRAIHRIIGAIDPMP